jgi:hypothetical protein
LTLSIIFDERITWRLHIEITESKAFRIFIRIYSIFIRECLSANVKITLHKALIRSVMTYACSAWELEANTYLFKFAAPAKQDYSLHWKFSEVHSGPRFVHGSNLPYVYDYVTKFCRQQEEVIRNHENQHVRSIGQGVARHQI